MNTQIPNDAMSGSALRLIRAAAVIDAAGVEAAPGFVLARGSEILAAGSPQSVGEPSEAVVEDLPDAIVIPSLANVHTHLDLSLLGPRPFNGDFAQWVEAIRAGRARSDADIASAVREGVRLARAGGTSLVGDIAGVRSTVPTSALRDAGMAGISFFEVFGVGRTQPAAMEAIQAAVDATPHLARGSRFGIQPHAPYSCGPELYREAARLNLPLATHLAETEEELEFVRSATGPLAEMLKRIDVWDDSIVAAHVHPVDAITKLLGGRPCIAAHLNYVDDEHLATLAGSNITVAFCPRASSYFGHAHHRYRDMLDRGVNVALGTDSIVCLDTPDRISTLDEMRLLHRRDGVDAVTLLRMATTAGARALGVRESLVTLKSGASAGLLALRIDGPAISAREALSRALQRDDPPRWLLGPVPGRNEWFE